MNAVEVVLRYMDGTMEAEEFEDILYKNSQMQAFLSDPSFDWISTGYSFRSTNVYEYLIGLDYSRLSQKLNSIGALELLLKHKKIEHREDNRYGELHGLLLDSMPGYIQMDINTNSEFFRNQISPIVEKDMTKTEKKKQIREKFKALFQYQSKPPRWIQGSEWPMNGDIPLFFVGQMELKHDTFHDNGAVYVFLNTENGEIETLTQFY